jgi:hypothetical protein
MGLAEALLAMSAFVIALQFLFSSCCPRIAIGVMTGERLNLPCAAHRSVLVPLNRHLAHLRSTHGIFDVRSKFFPEFLSIFRRCNTSTNIDNKE